MRRKQANPKPVKVEGDEMPGTTDSAQSQKSLSPVHGQSSNRESSDAEEYAESLVIDTGSVPSALSDSPDLCEPVDSPDKYSIIELHRSVEMVYYPDANAEDAESQEAISSDSCDKDMSLSGSVSNSEISNNLSSVSLADVSLQETEQTSTAKSKHSLSKSRKKTDRILPKTGVNGEKKYFCPVCEDAFISEHEFTRHIRSHNSPTNVSTVNMCMICQKVLSSQSSLDRHMLVHSGERPFKCDSCGQAFTTNGNMHRHMRTHKNSQANAGLPNELVPKLRKKKKQVIPPNADDATSSQQLQRQIDLANSVERSTMNRKRKITDSSEDVEMLEKRNVDSNVVKYLLTLANSHDRAKKSSMITQSSARIDPTKYPLQCSECHTTFFSRFHLLTDLEEHERSQKNSLSVICVACGVKLNCVNDFGDHMLSAHCSPKEGTMLEGSENIKPAFNDLMAVVPFTSERFSQMYKIITEKPSKHQVQKSAVNYCFGCEQMSEKSYGCQMKKLGPNCSGSFCDFCRFFFYKCEQQKDHVLWQERDVILSGYSNQKMDSDKVIQDKMAKTEFLHMLDLKSLSESKTKHSKNSLQFDANQNVIKVLPCGEKTLMTLKSLPLLNVLQNSILPTILTEGTVDHARSAVGEEILVPAKAPVLNLSSISAKHIVALIESSKALPIQGSIKIDLPRLLVGSPGMDEERILPRLEDPMNPTIKLEDEERENSTEATDQPLSSTSGSLQFKCSQCPYSSTDRSTLVRHMRTHNGERPFQCLYCNYQFTTKANCERHIKKKHSAVHRETGANGTDSIQLPADSSTSARSHSSGHYQCKVCPKNFASRANLLRHMQRQHAGLGLASGSVSGSTGIQSGESLVCNGLTLLANEAENCSRQLSSNSEENVPLQLTSSNNVVDARQQPQTSSTYRGYAENAEDSDEPLDFSLKSQRTSTQSDYTGHSWESDEPIDLTIRGQGQQRHVPRESESSRSGRRLTVPHAMLKLPAPAKGTANEKAWIKKQRLATANAAKGLASDLHSVIGHFCCTICESVFKNKVELSIHMRSHNTETDSQFLGEASSSALDVKPDSQVKAVHPQFTVVASSTFSSSPSPLNKKLDFDKSPVLTKEPNNNVASSVNANFVNKPLETKPFNLDGDLASVNRILESTSGKQLQPLLAMTSSAASPSVSPCTSFHGRPDLAVSTMSMDHSFADAITKSLAQNITLKSEGLSGKRKAETMDDDEQAAAESRTIKKKRNSYADSPRKLLCEFCTRAFPWISSLKRHILTHTGQKPYRCKQCGTTFSTKSNRERHMIRKHGLDVHDPTTRQTMDRPYKCHLCVFSSFTTSGKLMRHYKVKHPDKEVPETLLTSTGSLSQDDSDLMSRSGELLTAEERAEMQNSEDDDEDPTDDEVNELTFQMMAKSRLMQTMNHTEAAASSCSLMTPVNGSVSHLFMVASKDNADGSAEKHINPERDNYNVDKITDCWKCKRTFSDRKTLLRHLKEHNIDLPFKCYLCDASFEDRLMSLEHKHDEHPSDWATVQEKNKVSNLSDYSEFMEAVVKDTLDGKVTRRTHEGVELDIKPEPDYAQRKVFCTLCPKRFWSLQDLRRHMRSHTGDRPFECDICLSRFTLKHSMVRHRRKHMTEGLGASGEAQGSASDEDSVHTLTTPGDGCAQSPSKISADSPDESARVSLSLGQILPSVSATASTNHLVSVENSTELSKSSSSSSLKIVLSPSKAISSVDQSDLLQTLLDIEDISTIDRMLESPTNAASMLGIRRPKS